MPSCLAQPSAPIRLVVRRVKRKWDGRSIQRNGSDTIIAAALPSRRRARGPVAKARLEEVATANASAVGMATADALPRETPARRLPRLRCPLPRKSLAPRPGLFAGAEPAVRVFALTAGPALDAAYEARWSSLIATSAGQRRPSISMRTRTRPLPVR